MRIDTTEYQWVHGREPRGRGLWWFDVKCPSGACHEVIHNGKYGEAKRRAVTFARKVRAWLVEVKP